MQSCKIKIYTIPTCPYCRMTKDFLKEKNLEFEDFNISENDDAAEEMKKKSGQEFVPVIEIDGQIIVGFQKEKLESMIK